jgi:hypothetical protein
MPWMLVYIAAIVLCGSTLLVRRNRPRDLHCAPSGQGALWRWTKMAGIGLVFLGFMHVFVQLRIYGWPGACSAADIDFWGHCSATELTYWLMLGVVGLVLWFVLSEVDPPAAEQRQQVRSAARPRA